jgi:hypothetical protein
MSVENMMDRTQKKKRNKNGKKQPTVYILLFSAVSTTPRWKKKEDKYGNASP